MDSNVIFESIEIESSTELFTNIYYKSIRTNYIEEIWYVNHAHPNINERYSRFKIRDQIIKAKN